jgi:hypothetical protein
MQKMIDDYRTYESNSCRNTFHYLVPGEEVVHLVHVVHDCCSLRQQRHPARRMNAECSPRGS